MAPKRQRRKEAVDLTGVDAPSTTVDLTEEGPTRPKRARRAPPADAEAGRAGPAARRREQPPQGAAEAEAPSGAAPKRGRSKKAASAQTARSDRAAPGAGGGAASEAAEPRVDKRGRPVPFKSKPTTADLDRIARAMPGSAHRMFLIEAKQLAPAGVANGPSQEFQVLGATGNVYTVTVCCQPTCSCPDFVRGNLCKHILFVMLRVLKQPNTNPLIWQRALLRNEVEQLLSATGSNAVDQTVMASARVRERFAAAQRGEASGDEGGEAGAGTSSGGRQRPVEGDCPVCFSEMDAGAEAIVFCNTCGNNIHKECFGHWASSKRNARLPVTCVYCRAPWAEPTAAAGTPGSGSKGPKVFGREYMNLAQYSDAHRSGTDLTSLYGDTAPFVMANMGMMRLGDAIRMHQAGAGRR